MMDLRLKWKRRKYVCKERKKLITTKKKKKKNTGSRKRKVEVKILSQPILLLLLSSSSAWGGEGVRTSHVLSLKGRDRRNEKRPLVLWLGRGCLACLAGLVLWLEERGSRGVRRGGEKKTRFPLAPRCLVRMQPRVFLNRGIGYNSGSSSFRSANEMKTVAEFSSAMQNEEQSPLAGQSLDSACESSAGSRFAGGAGDFASQSAAGQKNNPTELAICHDQAFYNHFIAKLLYVRGFFAEVIDFEHLQSMIGFEQCIRYPLPQWVPHRSVPLVFDLFELFTAKKQELPTTKKFGLYQFYGIDDPESSPFVVSLNSPASLFTDHPSLHDSFFALRS